MQVYRNLYGNHTWWLGIITFIISEPVKPGYGNLHWHKSQILPAFTSYGTNFCSYVWTTLSHVCVHMVCLIVYDTVMCAHKLCLLVCETVLCSRILCVLVCRTVLCVHMLCLLAGGTVLCAHILCVFVCETVLWDRGVLSWICVCYLWWYLAQAYNSF